MMLPCFPSHKTLILYGQKGKQGLVSPLFPLVSLLLQLVIKTIRRTKMKHQLIAIDTEYNANEDLGTINKVYCIAACDESGKRFTKWFKEQYDPNILEDIKTALKAENPIFVCFAFEIAERKALLKLGVDLHEYDFIDSWLIEKFLTQSVEKSEKSKTDDLSLVATTKRYKLTIRDCEQKELMRQYCITDTTTGHEQDIMDYCFDDVKDLIPLFNLQLKKYREAIKWALNVHRNQALHARFNKNSQRYSDINSDESFYNIFTLHTEMLKGFGEIADRGIPVDLNRLQHFKDRASIVQKRLEDNLMRNYDAQIFNTDKKGKRSMSTLIVQDLLRQELSDEQLQHYPKTKTGLLKTGKDELKEYFKNKTGFGHDLYEYLKIRNSLKMLVNCKPENIFEGYLKYESLKPWGTRTGRCAPSTRKFIWGWHKALFPIIQPSDENTWLVELDFNSQETFLQAALCKDEVCYEAYKSKDIYMYFLHRFGKIPTEDWEALTVDELKKKYGHLRKPFKSVLLGSSYGLGAKKLAARENMPLEQAKDILKDIDESMEASSNFKHQIYEACNDFDYIGTDDFALSKLPLRNDDIFTTMKNFSFQSMGATILHWVVRELYKNPDKYNVKVISTVHDALWFECKKGDLDAIRKVSELMKTFANHYSLAPAGWSIKIGSPEIVEKGDWFVGEETYIKLFAELWTDDINEQQTIISQYKQQQSRNERYLQNY